jgi:DNA-binding NarL/FixJ family response regulator
MADDRTRKNVRDLLSGIDRHGGRLPLAEVIDLAETADRRVTIDRSEDPPVVFVGPTRSTRFHGLSNRELEVAALLAEGMTNRQIACELFISIATTKDHVHAVLSKTGFANRAAVVSAWHRGDSG